jgi:hypothetical protein
MHHIAEETYLEIPEETYLEPKRRRRLGRGTLLAAGALAAGIALAACGGGRSAPGVAAASTTTATASHSTGGGTQATGLLAYSSCVRSHGVPNFPDPSGSGGIPKQAVVNAFREVSNSQAEAAQNDCKDLLPPGGSLSGQASQPVTAQDQQDYLKAAACMRSHGIANFPDPTFSGGSVDLNIPSSIDTNSKQFNQAREICQKLIPRGLPDSGSEG